MSHNNLIQTNIHFERLLVWQEKKREKERKTASVHHVLSYVVIPMRIHATVSIGLRSRYVKHNKKSHKMLKRCLCWVFKETFHSIITLPLDRSNY